MAIEKKIVNLDDEGKSVSITIGGKDFVISRITLRARQKYGEYLVFCGEHYQKSIDVNKRIEAAGEDPSILASMQSEIALAIENFSIEKARKIEGLLQIILEKNGYEYSRDWWEENTDYNKMELFIVSALKKDEVENAQPKKKEMNATSIE